MFIFWKRLLASLLVFICLCCTTSTSPKKETDEVAIPLKYSTTFQLFEAANYKKIVIVKPWPEAQTQLTYYLAEDKKYIPENAHYDAYIPLPINRIVLTSTTHIPALISLQQLDKWVGFPGLQYISSPEARAMINNEKLTELGTNEALNTEKLLALRPDVVVGFGVSGSNKSLTTISKVGIPVIYNSDWLDNHPLGKAEWIKFFGFLTGTYEAAEEEFERIEKNYLNLKDIAQSATVSPTVFSGAMYKDTWYLPGGNSWQAEFLKDANASYVYADTEAEGSLSYSFETVLSHAKDTEYWISPAQFTSYLQMQESSHHYSEFEAFKNKKIYTIAKTKGATGGVLYYELAPNRPDLVLRDLIQILHPNLLPPEDLYFLQPFDE